MYSPYQLTYSVVVSGRCVFIASLLWLSPTLHVQRFPDVKYVMCSFIGIPCWHTLFSGAGLPYGHNCNYDRPAVLLSDWMWGREAKMCGGKCTARHAQLRGPSSLRIGMLWIALQHLITILRTQVYIYIYIYISIYWVSGGSVFQGAKSLCMFTHCLTKSVSACWPFYFCFLEW